MSYGETKVYFDGSHYIAIPHTTRNVKRRPRPQEDLIIIKQEEESSPEISDEPSILAENCETNDSEEFINETQNDENTAKTTPKKTRQITKKELFEELYRKYIDLRKNQRKKQIIQDMLPYFENEDYCKNFVQLNMDRKQRNLICRRVRMVRKANLVNFNYFCTFTYDDSKHTEETFKKKLKTCFKMLCHRRHWKYMGVWERAPETKRLHFHGLFSIPDGKMVGSLEQHSDYNFKSKRRTKTLQNTYFNERFGRTDFASIDHDQELRKELTYIMKYIEKTEEKIVYSKGLYQYFISDIMDEDIVCTIGQEDKKLLLFDDFNCWDEGVLMGKVSPEVIGQMRKCN